MLFLKRLKISSKVNRMSEENLQSSKKTARKKFALQPTLDRYVLKEFLLPLIVLILGFLTLFMIGDIFDDLSDFLDHKATVYQIIKYFLLKVPGNIRFILPISVLLACMYTMANFAKNLEITAMRASGISVQRACAPIYFIAAIVAAVTCWFNEAFVPFTDRQAYVLRKTVTTEGFFKDVRENLSYRSPDGKTTWLFNNFDKDGVERDVFLKYFDRDGAMVWDLKAKSAEFVPEKGWIFTEGECTKFDKINQFPGPSRSFKSNYDKQLPLPKEIRDDIAAFTETPHDIYNAVKNIDNLTSLEILDLLSKSQHMSQNKKNLYWTTLFYRISFFPCAALIAAFLGIPLATKNLRSGIFMSIIIAVFIIMSYIVISEMCRVAGNRGYLPPIVAGMGPTIAFIIYGWYNVVKQD
jgi:LPS export ABC transporter permease LptG